MGALVQPRYNNAIFAVIDSNSKENSMGLIGQTRNLHAKVMPHFGWEDGILNHLLLIK
jgi:hypothetical protein